jgi:hypothetical protein
MCTGTLRQPAMQTRYTIFIPTMTFATIPSQAIESLVETICRPCAAITPAGRQVFNVRRMLGRGDLWIMEYTNVYQGRSAFTVSIMEFHDGKVVHETQYFADPFDAPAWRGQWVQQIA